MTLNTVLMRTALLAGAVLASGCASTRVTGCTKLVGPNWDFMPKPPANADTLLRMENLPPDADVRWFARGGDQVLACVYSPPINNPSCNSSTAYIYGRDGDLWHYRDQMVDVCATGEDGH